MKSQMMNSGGLGSISGKIQNESVLLMRLNDSLLALEIDAIGRNSDLGIAAENVAESREFIADFIRRLIRALKGGSSSVDISPVVYHISSGYKPIEDWVQDLESLVGDIKKDKVAKESVFIIEEVLSLLDDQFSDDLRQLFVA
jgi:hypothetical protein